MTAKTTDSTHIIKIVSSNEKDAGCGSSVKPSAGQPFAAGIDTDIFEADIQELGGERFWEAFWRTQLTYGGIAEGQSLAVILDSLPEDVFGKLGEDIERLRVDHLQMHDDEKNDIFGMVIFLLGIERADASYDPIEHEGYEASMARFIHALSQEQQRRTRT